MSEVPVPPPRSKKTQPPPDLSPSAGSAVNAVRGPGRVPTYQDVSATPALGASRAPQQQPQPRSVSPSQLSSGVPETVIGEYVVVKGELEFDRLLRIDGLFEGRLISSGDLIIGPQGKLVGPVSGMRSMLVQGCVIGDIEVERLALSGAAFVFGDITCQAISVEPTVRIVGKLNVHAAAPAVIDAEGNAVNVAADNNKAEHHAGVSVAGHEDKKIKGEFRFHEEPEVQHLVVSSEKHTLIAGADEAAAEARAKHMTEQRKELERQYEEQKRSSEAAMEADEKEIERLKTETERLRHEAEQRQAHHNKLKAESEEELRRLQSELAAAETAPVETQAEGS